VSAVVTYLVCVLVFALLFRALHVWRICRSSMTLVSGVLQVVANDLKSDEEKEVAAKGAAIRLGGDTLRLMLKLIVLVSLSVLPAWLSDWAGLSRLSQTLAFALRPDVILLTIVGVPLIVIVLHTGHLHKGKGV
jgi:hypothetical protein